MNLRPSPRRHRNKPPGTPLRQRPRRLRRLQKKATAKSAASPTTLLLPPLPKAEQLHIPICFHTGSGSPEERRGLMRSKAPAINGVYAILEDNIHARFPSLRFGCIESGAPWIPFVDYQLRRPRHRHQFSSNVARRSLEFTLDDDLFKSNRVYVGCQVDENIPMILNYISEDNLIIGSDYTHQDTSHELDSNACSKSASSVENSPSPSPAK